MKSSDLVVLALGGVAVYFLYKTLNKAACEVNTVTCDLLHPNCALTNSLQAACNWLKCELGVSCGQ